MDWPSHNVKLAKSPMANPPPKSQETAQSMTLGSQISMATVVRIREPVSIPDNSNNDTTAAWLRTDHTMTVINPIARYMPSIATAKATPIFRQWRMSAGTCLRVQSLNARILADSGTAAHRKPIENTMAAFSQLWQDIQQEVQVPEGYKLQYFGEQSEQDKGNKAIAANIPLMFGLIYLTLLFLFPKYYRKPVLIMCMLPLIFIGVVLGLLVFGKSLDFFAMLGLLGLIGMNIKNAIVLVDEIGLQLNAGLSPVMP